MVEGPWGSVDGGYGGGGGGDGGECRGRAGAEGRGGSVVARTHECGKAALVSAVARSPGSRRVKARGGARVLRR